MSTYVGQSGGRVTHEDRSAGVESDETAVHFVI